MRGLDWAYCTMQQRTENVLEGLRLSGVDPSLLEEARQHCSYAHIIAGQVIVNPFQSTGLDEHFNNMVEDAKDVGIVTKRCHPNVFETVDEDAVIIQGMSKRVEMAWYDGSSHHGLMSDHVNGVTAVLLLHGSGYAVEHLLLDSGAVFDIIP